MIYKCKGCGKTIEYTPETEFFVKCYQKQGILYCPKCLENLMREGEPQYSNSDPNETGEEAAARKAQQ